MGAVVDEACSRLFDLIFAILLLLAAMYLVFDASFHRELGVVLACSATIVGMAAIIYCLVTHLSRMK